MPEGGKMNQQHRPEFDRERQSTALFHPAVAAWFEESFAAPTEARAEAWPAIRAEHDRALAALLHSPPYRGRLRRLSDRQLDSGSAAGCRRRTPNLTSGS
jgi:hypothetical protein